MENKVEKKKFCKYCQEKRRKTLLIRKKLYEKGFEMDYCPKCDIYFG